MSLLLFCCRLNATDGLVPRSFLMVLKGIQLIKVVSELLLKGE
ncbi:hypothetical protein SeseC_01668 [Streptococcus equi subsp. zooepidemicus ATCC 35246]|nr:hypothetical protein SeseC_01668 [Streptococcus equi subsp. zooepidemicus ATCC 35246]